MRQKDETNYLKWIIYFVLFLCVFSHAWAVFQASALALDEPPELFSKFARFFPGAAEKILELETAGYPMVAAQYTIFFSVQALILIVCLIAIVSAFFFTNFGYPNMPDKNYEKVPKIVNLARFRNAANKLSARWLWPMLILIYLLCFYDFVFNSGKSIEVTNYGVHPRRNFLMLFGSDLRDYSIVTLTTPVLMMYINVRFRGADGSGILQLKKHLYGE